ncbi:long-chain-fatty-acid--CoA ligase [Sphingopyxis sp. FD7]|uniref:long-chain-fatty-acid--CoA ligase n=1 Tax=Sphingopyxis sp. FD7 TaxID=1914525 RepID=UPI000DC6244C|nr:long-chain-fatty-acid--CoA ligase [Sphingopyxis sp. FD7]BBB14386.1 AMP-dependent synthetase [Sphingopyxis sp. FD7]
MPAPPVDIVSMLRHHVAGDPAARCITSGDISLTFSELDCRSNAAANALVRSGVASGDRVALLCQASPEVFELLFACAKIGAILVPLNWRLSAREIAQIVEDADPILIIFDAASAPLVAEVGGRTKLRLEDYPAMRDAVPDSIPAHDVVPDDTALILYTSGTTGRPKGAMLSQRNLSYLGRMAGELWQFTSQSVNLVAMPLFHIGGIGYALLALSQGGETVLLPSADPALVLNAIARHGVTHAFFVPTVVQRLVDHVAESGMVAPAIDHIFYGAAPIGEELLHRAIATFGCGFTHVYGMTETAGTTVTLLPHEHTGARLRSCGRPMPWVELEVVDPDTGRQVASGETGEIRMRSPAIMRQYWRKQEETAAAITADGWLCSGDAASRDADGYLYIHDRYKDMIVSGGENIYPSEIDNVLLHHPAVAEVAVIGIPHPKWGETPCAYVVRRPGFGITEAELIAFTRERLAHYKCPTSVRFVAELPRNASGKILKRELRERSGGTGK